MILHSNALPGYPYPAAAKGVIMENSIPIVCPYCGVGCNLELVLDEKGMPVKSSCSGRNEELNGRYICVKGFSIPEILTSGERLASPLIRKRGKLQKASWEEAVGQAAGGLRATHGIWPALPAITASPCRLLAA